MRDVLGPFEAAREYARALNQARKALDALVEIEEATRPGTKLDVQGRKEIHAIARRGVLAAQSLMSTSPGKDPGNIAPPVDSREPCVCRLTGGACAGASRPTALDAATVEACAKEADAVCEDYNQRMNRFCKAGGKVTDDVYHRLSENWNGAAWVGQRIRALVESSSAEPKASKNSESPPPAGPTGMKPGQRCTGVKGHELFASHEFNADYDRDWERLRTEGKPTPGIRCPYVEAPAGPVCASCKPWCGSDWRDHDDVRLDHNRRPIERHWQRAGSGLCFCTEACRDAGRPLHPEVPHGT